MAVKRRTFIRVSCLIVGVLACNAWATIVYDLNQTDAATWKYTYEIRNDLHAGPLKALTIWFDPVIYSDLIITSSPDVQANWSEGILLSVPGLGNGYDVFGDDGVIDVGGAVGGFSVSFKWLGEGMPGPQLFQILDPVTFETTYEGMTVPEPGSLVLMLGGAALFRRRRMRSGPRLNQS